MSQSQSYHSTIKDIKCIHPSQSTYIWHSDTAKRGFIYVDLHATQSESAGYIRCYACRMCCIYALDSLLPGACPGHCGPER